MNSQTLQPNASLQGGKYRIVRVLGQGGFGITYLAEHKVLDTKVAIKEFFMKELNNRDESTSQVSVGSEGSRELVMKFRDKFIKEARNIASLKHPNIIRIHDVFEENGTAYYVMEYCDGESLNELLKMHPAGLGEAMAVKYIRQVASALRYIHERKMNHLDVKPGNIMINAGNAVLIDFGLSKQYDSTGSQTSTTPVGISHGFAPIEQYKQGGVSEFSPATDIYSLGATLYKLITGQTPPDAQTLIEEDLPMINATAPVANAIRQAMQVSRSNRPLSIAAWLQLLDSSSQASIDDESTQKLQSAWHEEKEHLAQQCRDQELVTKKSSLSNPLIRFVFFLIICGVGALVYYYYTSQPVTVSYTIKAYESGETFDGKGPEITGANVYLDGTKLSMTTPCVINVVEGHHTLRICHPDYEDVSLEKPVYHYMNGNYNITTSLKNKYRWKYKGIISVYYNDVYGSLSDASKKIYERKTKSGKTEYASVSLLNDPEEANVVKGEYSFHGDRFNAKIRGKEIYLNIEQ